MDNSSDEYHISFFKPTTPHATANRNMVVWLVLIWFITIFGFQAFLWIIEKPTPEPAYIAFEKVWGDIESGSPDPVQLQEFGQATLSVLGKIALAPDDRSTLDNALSWTIYQLTEDAKKADFIERVTIFEDIKEKSNDISDPKYINAKKSLSAELSPMLSLSSLDIRTKILPLELSSKNIDNLKGSTKSNMPGIMKKYLIHNQSFLTDMKFLGFPFHYFYTAIFLLILFVGLCLLYCVRTDILNARFNIVD